MAPECWKLLGGGQLRLASDSRAPGADATQMYVMMALRRTGKGRCEVVASEECITVCRAFKLVGSVGVAWVWTAAHLHSSQFP